MPLYIRPLPIGFGNKPFSLTNTVRLFTILVVVFSIASCDTTSDQHSSAARLRAGEWQLLFDISDSVPGVKIPIRLVADSLGKLSIHNDGESIALEDIQWNGDSVQIRAPFFQTFLHAKITGDSMLNGYLHEPTRTSAYMIPFEAKFIGALSEETGTERDMVFDATFSKGVEDDQYKAVAILKRNGEQISGTFLTETGDYRFLQGRVSKSDEGDNLMLSCWDGAHLFYFDGEMEGDSIRNGRFCSGRLDRCFHQSPNLTRGSITT